MTTKTFTRQEVVDLYHGLQQVANLSGAKFAYAVARNVDKLESVVKALNKAYRPDNDFIEYDKKRADLAKEYAEVDSHGNPRTTVRDGVEEYKMADKEAFDKEYESLKKEYKEVIEKRDAQLEDFKKLTEEEVEVELYMVYQEYIPENITAGQMTAIFPIILDEDTPENDMV